jgi:hypothetical protein
MPTIGYTTAGGSFGSTASNWSAEATVASAYRYTAVTGDTVTQVAVYGANSGQCQVGIYTFSGGVPVTRVGTVNVTIGAGAGWHTAAANIALTNGVEYVIAIDYWNPGAVSWDSYYDSGSAGDTSVDNGVTLDATWSQASTTAFLTSFYATVTTTYATKKNASDKFTGGILGDNVSTTDNNYPGVTCTASATPHAVGAWQVLDASLSANCDGITIWIAASTNTSSGNSSTILEIGTGAGGAETVWASILVGYRQNGAGEMITVPGYIASGTRVVARARAVEVSQTVFFGYFFHPATKTGVFPAPTTYGIDTSTSRGTTVTAPGSLNTKGAWTNIGSATSVEHDALCITCQNAGGTAMHGSSILIDIGWDSTVKLPDLALYGATTEYYTPYTPMTYGIYVPSGVTLQARYARANSGNALDLAIVGA